MKHHQTLISELMDLLEGIAQNTQYPQFFFNERCLVDHKTYLNLCKYIFPELKGEFVHIENLNTQASDKLNRLLQLLSDALRIDLSKVDGAEITRYNLSHIHHFVMVLHEYSKILNESANRKPVVRSESGSGDFRQHDPQVPKSARGPVQDYPEQERHNNEIMSRDKKHKDYPTNNHQRKKDNHQKLMQERQAFQKQHNHEDRHFSADHRQEKGHVHFADQDEYLISTNAQQGKQKKAKKNKSNRRGRSQRSEKENLHSSVVNTFLNEKTRMLKAGQRDNRKNKIEQIENAKEQYRTFLKSYTKHNKAQNNRESALALKSAAAVPPVKQELPIQDFDKIDNFFQSFAYRFRDKKAIYLRKISELIRKQEVDRYCYQNRIERETKKYMDERLIQELQGARHQHRVKSALLRENASHLEAEVTSMRKEQQRLAAQQRRQLKQTKKKELQRIETVLREDNQRVLMSLEEGGRLEQLIMKMYKKF